MLQRHMGDSNYQVASTSVGSSPATETLLQAAPDKHALLTLTPHQLSSRSHSQKHGGLGWKGTLIHPIPWAGAGPSTGPRCSSAHGSLSQSSFGPSFSTYNHDMLLKQLQTSTITCQKQFVQKLDVHEHRYSSYPIPELCLVLNLKSMSASAHSSHFPQIHPHSPGHRTGMAGGVYSHLLCSSLPFQTNSKPKNTLECISLKSFTTERISFLCPF